MISIGAITINRIISPLTAGISGITADNYAARLATNGGTINQGSLDLLTTFVEGCKADGIWTGILDQGLILPFLGNNLAAAITPLVAPINTQIVAVNFVEGDWTESTGLDPGSGGTKYLKLGFSPSTHLADQNSSHLCFYSRTDVAAADVVDIGVRGSSTASSFELALKRNGNFQFSAYNFGSTGFVSVANAASLGWHLGARIANNNSRLYKESGQVGINSGTNTSSPPSGECYLGGINNNGAFSKASSRICTYASAGVGLNSTQQGLYKTRIVNLQTSLARNV
jgi:hypothetical protein